MTSPTHDKEWIKLPKYKLNGEDVECYTLGDNKGIYVCPKSLLDQIRRDVEKELFDKILSYTETEDNCGVWETIGYIRSDDIKELRAKTLNNKSTDLSSSVSERNVTGNK